MHVPRFGLLLGLIALSVFAIGARMAQAEPDSPTATIGSGTAASCQSNAAVNAFKDAVAAGGVIDFNCGPNTVTIHVNTNIAHLPVTVNGDNRIILSGEDLRQIFYVMGTGHLTLNDIILSDGEASQGGAIYVEQNAAVTLNRTFINGSRATSSGGAVYNRGTVTINDSTLGSNIANVTGGGIFNNGGTVTVRRSYLISNQAASGGAVYTVNGQLTLDRSAVRSSVISNQGGGIFAAGPMTITNSTFSNNRALQGGALFLIANATILNSTFNENRANTAGAIWREASSSTTIKNSIVAGSLDTNGNFPSLNCDGPPLTSLGRNVVSDGTCIPDAPGDLRNTNPLLGIWLGSPIRAYIPQPGSPAIDYGVGCPAIDQRGFPRPLGAACDSGSIEVGGVVYIPMVRR
jgi:hypothetical protein